MAAVRSLVEAPGPPRPRAIRPVQEPAVRYEPVVEVGLEGECPIIKSGLHQVLRASGITASESHRPEAGGVIVLVHRGGEALRDLGDYAGSGCAVLAAQPGPTAAFEMSALSAGYHGVVDCQGPTSQIALSIQVALTGQVVLSQAVARHLADRARSDRASADLTEAEVRWLGALARGTSVVDLATAEAYSERAMYRRLSDLYRKMDVRTRGEAIAVASRHGLI